MAEEKQDKIALALKAIGHWRDLRVNIADGVIVSIPAQRIVVADEAGVKTEKVIEREIKR